MGAIVTKRKKLSLNDTLMDALVLMAEGNPGAITVLMKLLDGPEDAGWGEILHLDDMNMRGSQIWAAYKDVCGQDIEKFRKAIFARDPEMVEAINKHRGVGQERAVTHGASFEHRRWLTTGSRASSASPSASSWAFCSQRRQSAIMEAKRSDWDAVTVDELRDLYVGQNLSYSDIAALFDGVTRNQVAGRCSREGLRREPISEFERNERKRDARDLAMLRDLDEGHALRTTAAAYGVDRDYLRRLVNITKVQ